MKNQGQEEVNLEQLEGEIQQRDYQDSNRKIAPLKKAVDAIEVNTDGLSIEEVRERIIGLYQQKISA